MPTSPLPEKTRELLTKPNPAVITSLRADGQPVSVATWVLLEDDGRVLVNMDEGRKRLDYLRSDPGVSLLRRPALQPGARPGECLDRDRPLARLGRHRLTIGKVGRLLSCCR